MNRLDCKENLEVVIYKCFLSNVYNEHQNVATILECIN